MQMVRLDEFCTFSAGGKQKINKSHYVESGFPAFSAAGQDGFVEKWEYNRPAVVVTSVGSCGRAYLATGQWTSLANTYLVFPDTERCFPDYLWYILNDPDSWIISGTAQPFIKPSDIKARLVPLPGLDDQRRIASVLNRVGRIEALHLRAAEAASALSRSLMSRLLEQNR